MPLSVSITYANFKPALNQNKELETETKNRETKTELKIWKHFENDLTRDKNLENKLKSQIRREEGGEGGREELPNESYA